MRDPKRIINVLNHIDDFWMKHPDMRLGQIISNASSNLKLGADPYYMEDEALVIALLDMERPVCRDRPVTTTCDHCGRTVEGAKIDWGNGIQKDS